MKRFSMEGDESDYNFHLEDEGEFWEQVKEFENTEKSNETVENAPKLNICDICKKKFRSRYHLKLHMPVHTGEKNYTCGICRKSFQQKWNLITHTERVHAKEKPFHCKECGKTFGYSSHFKRHAKSHFVEKMQVPDEIKRKLLHPFSCKHCSKSFDTNYRLKLHLEKHEDSDKYVCEKCGLMFNMKAMDNHLAQHEVVDNETREAPHENNFSVLYYPEGVQNLIESTNGVYYALNPTQKKEVLPCEVCGKIVARESLKKHLNIHYRSRVYDCQYCGKQFLESGQRNIHERSHTGEKPYLCDFCGKGHSQYGNLITHLISCHNVIKNRKPQTVTTNKTVPTVIGSNDDDIMHLRMENLENFALNSTYLFPYGQEGGNETVVGVAHVSDKWMGYGDEIFGPPGISAAHIAESMPNRALGLNIADSTVAKNMAQANEIMPEETAKKIYKQNAELMKEMKKKMNRKIFEKLVEGLYESDVSNKIKLTVENIRRSSILDDIDPLKEYLRIVKSFPANSVARHVNGKMRWICWICNSDFINRHILARHLVTHEPKEKRPFRCEKCQKSFTQSNNFKEHLMSHSNKKQFYCEKCGFGFRHKSHFNNHLKRHSNDPLPEKPKRFACLHCGKKFHTSFHRDEHIRSHTKERPYMCKICGAQFSAMSTLHRHGEVHSNNQYKCQICLKYFKQKSSLKRHVNSHEEFGARKIICECGKSFSQKSSLSKHKMICQIRQEPVDKSYYCFICPKKFLTKSDLKRHSATHDKAPLYKCDVCFVSLKSKETYWRHVRRHN